MLGAASIEQPADVLVERLLGRVGPVLLLHHLQQLGARSLWVLGVGAVVLDVRLYLRRVPAVPEHRVE